jgi:hypothetical protein
MISGRALALGSRTRKNLDVVLTAKHLHQPLSRIHPERNHR